MLDYLISEKLEQELVFIFKEEKLLDTDLKQEIDISDSAFYHRLFYTIRWCQNHRTTHSYEQIIFPRGGKEKVLVRRVSLSIKSDQSVLVLVNPATSIEYSNMSQSFIMFDQAKDPIWVSEAEPIDQPGPRVIYANQAFLDETGYKKEEILGNTPRILQGDDSSLGVRERIRKGLKNWSTIQESLIHYRKNGTTFLVELNITPVRDVTGWWTQWFSVQKNVTKELQQTNKLSKLQEIGDIGYFSIKKNSLAVELSEYSSNFFSEDNKREVLLPEWLQHFDAESQIYITKSISDCFTQGNSFARDLTLKKYLVDYRFKLIGDAVKSKDGQILEIFGILKNIIESKEQEENLELILDNISEGYWDWWIKEDYEYMSPRFWEIFGIDPKTKKHRPSEWQKIIHPDDLKIAFDNFEKHVATKGEHPFDQEVRYQHANGNWIWIHCKGNVVQWDGDEPIRMVGSHTDVTKRKETELEKEEQKKVAIFQAKLASIGELAASVGHEINNPLTIAMAQLQFLKRDADSSSLRKLAKVDQALEKIKNITSNLRGVSRVDHKRQRIDLNFLVQDSVNFINEFYKKQGIEIITECTEDESFGDVCKGEVQQILMNLLSNAKDALENQSHKKIKIKTISTTNSFSFSVQDNGSGMSEETQKKIYDSFFTTKAEGKGVGIGMAITKDLVEKHDGKIEFESELEKGTTFKVTLPIRSRQEQMPVDSLETKKNATLLPTLNILLVEDEPEIMELIQEYLSGINCQVQTACNGKEALDCVCQSGKSFDLVISDVRMPLMDGIEFFDLIQSNEKIKKKPKFLFISGGLKQEQYQKALDNNDDVGGFLTKPFDSEDLYSKINNIVINSLA